MDLGKIKLPIGRVFNGDVVASLQDIFVALDVLRTELDVLPGFVAFYASVAITKGQAVNWNSGTLRLADASLGRPAFGIASATVAPGEKLRIMAGSGYLSGLTGLTPDTIIYLGNAGALTFIRTGANIQALGYALTATDMFVNINPDLIP